MRSLASLLRNRSDSLSILCLGAHSDDIEIGCGGTLLRLLEMAPMLNVTWVVFSGDSRRQEEARESARELLSTGVADLEFRTYSFDDGFFPNAWAGLKEQFHQLSDACQPDIVFTHFRDDRHQDHRVVSELTWTAFRDHLVLEYEIPKWDGDLAQPNLFVPFTKEIALKKARHLVAAFPTQREKAWFTEDTFLGLSRIRGIECGAPGGFAEGFHGRKAVLWD